MATSSRRCRQSARASRAFCPTLGLDRTLDVCGDKHALVSAGEIQLALLRAISNTKGPPVDRGECVAREVRPQRAEMVAPVIFYACLYARGLQIRAHSSYLEAAAYPRIWSKIRICAYFPLLVQGCKTSIPGSNPGGASTFSVQIRSLCADGTNGRRADGRQWTTNRAWRLSPLS